MKNYDEIRNHFYGTLGFIQLLDMRITELSEGYCKGEIPHKPESHNALAFYPLSHLHSLVGYLKGHDLYKIT